MNPLKKDDSGRLMATVRVLAFAVGAFLFFLVLILLLCVIAIINLTRFELSDQAANSSEMAPLPVNRESLRMRARRPWAIGQRRERLLAMDRDLNLVGAIALGGLPLPPAVLVAWRLHRRLVPERL